MTDDTIKTLKAAEQSAVTLTFDVLIPLPDEAGYMGFLDDMMTVMQYQTEGESDGSFSPKAWQAMKSFLTNVIDTDDPAATFRSLSMPMMQAVFSQVVAAVNNEKKE